MSFPYTPNLQTQLDYLNLLRLRHLQWMTAAGDPATKEMHSNIVEQIEKVTDRYSGLLYTLQR